VTDPPFNLIASGGASGNPILFTSSNSSVATVLGNIVTIVGAGITTITASQSGNTLYDSAISIPQSLIVNSSSSIVNFNFGSVSAPTAFASNGVPISNLNISAISQGNNANISQTSINISSTSASTNSGASGEMNAGITARNRSFQIDSSAYFEFTLTPSSGNTVTLNSLNFGSRSTGTGPTTLDIRTSANNFSSSISTNPVLSNSSWTLISPTFPSISSTTPLTVRIYGYVTGGSGSINTGTSPNNWRIDDLNLNISMSTSYACSLSVSATSSPILCNGGEGAIQVQVNNANGTVNYSLNNSPSQTNPIFNNVVANTYTVSVLDAFLCTATTIIVLTEPAPSLVTTSNVTSCEGASIALTGFPIGGIFSVANPYTGPSTIFTYSYTDSLGCVTISSPANITVTPCAVLNLKLFFQSYYLGSGLMESVLFNQGVSLSQLIVDDIIVELYDPISFTLVSSGSGSLGIDGTVSISYPNISGSYYIAIRYRNALQAWSAIPVSLGAIPYFYDFSNGQCKTYGCNAVLVDTGVWAIYSGDIVQDENIDLLDLSTVEADIQNFEFGYFSTDLNGDGNVDLLDMPLLEESIGNFVFANHPVFIVFPETMESGTKTNYTSANITLSTGVWTFDDALIGTSSSDRKIGSKSARIQNLGKISMNFNVYIDSSIITVWHAKYASESNSTWALYKSIDNGNTWSQEGSTVSTISTTIQSVSFIVNWEGNIRFEIRKLSGGRLNIDDFNITANTGVVVVNDNDHIAFGNPSNAVTDISIPDNYLVIKNQFDYAYDNSKGSAAWVAWHLDINDIGTTPRCDCFATDVQLPSSFYRANSFAYSGSGFDRGHQVPSSHRNNNITNNAVTFLMSNMMPQAPNLNQITWNNLEQYCTSLVNAGYELYTYSGGYGSGGTGSNGGITYTIASGNINVPSHFWKIILALPAGNNDISRVTTTTRVIAVDMPNTQTVNASAWGNYRTSVDAIEAATGFDFFKSLSVSLENAIETIIDNGPTN
ncbi:MAG TPA: DNA/RNA non-specific endonuclease, partial [Chitinophagaceae bacterium]|nr:DNA/RNA non-specific endonuclease [Chitinophagaceae bacterium]